MLKLAYNTTDSAVLVDEAGYFIGGREWGAIETTDPIGSAELGAQRVVLVDEDAAAASDNPLAHEAVAALNMRRDREAAVKQLSKDELREVAPDTVEDDATVAELREAVADDPEVQLPETPAKKTTTSRTAAKK